MLAFIFFERQVHIDPRDMSPNTVLARQDILRNVIRPLSTGALFPSRLNTYPARRVRSSWHGRVPLPAPCLRSHSDSPPTISAPDSVSRDRMSMRAAIA